MKSQKKLQNELSEAIQRAGTLKVLHTNAVASRIGLSATEFEAMDIISRCQPMTAGKLAEYCGLTTGAITGLVDRLERAGFVQRERDSEDSGSQSTGKSVAAAPPAGREADRKRRSGREEARCAEGRQRRDDRLVRVEGDGRY